MPNSSRRDFLKNAAIATTAIAASVPLRWSSKAFAQASRPAGPKLNLALIGCGSQGRADLGNAVSVGVNVVALCDVDRNQIAATKARFKALDAIKGYSDYRKLLDEEKSLEGVIIATPDHWHAPLCKAFIQAGKHVYCEKPLTHSIGEARELRELSKSSQVATQMGNQGSASTLMRRSIELIQAGVLGQIREIHAYPPTGRIPRGINRPDGADPVPPNLNWDCWVGPAPLRPYVGKIYHPYNWRGWYDFGGGRLGDWGCHAFNLPMRALDLDYPQSIQVTGTGFGKETSMNNGTVQFHFAARGKLAPIVLHWYDGLRPQASIMKDVLDQYKGKPPADGVLLIGEKGLIWTDGHNEGDIIKLTGEARFRDVAHHAATQNIPRTIPRVPSHMAEWLSACQGGPAAFSNFEVGGHLTEIVLAGVLAQRLGQDIEWDGEKMQCANHPEAKVMVQPNLRKTWLRS